MDKGKPLERLGCKATHLRFLTMIAELPSQNNCISGGFIVTVITSKKALDKEWTGLILEARNLGISIEETKEFLKNTSKT
jgi:hypothetical protein